MVVWRVPCEVWQCQARSQQTGGRRKTSPHELVSKLHRNAFSVRFLSQIYQLRLRHAIDKCYYNFSVDNFQLGAQKTSFSGWHLAQMAMVLVLLSGAALGRPTVLHTSGETLPLVAAWNAVVTRWCLVRVALLNCTLHDCTPCTQACSDRTLMQIKKPLSGCHGSRDRVPCAPPDCNP